jgi:uncharacterized protein
MITTLRQFIADLRLVGVRISVTETLDAIATMHHFELDDRAAFKDALASTLIKEAGHRPVYDTLFDVYFSLDRLDLEIMSQSELDEGAPLRRVAAGRLPTRDEIRRLLEEALWTGDRRLIRIRARQAVTVLSGFRPGGAVGTLLYTYRTLKALDLEAMRDRFEAEAATADDIGELQRRLDEEELESRLDLVRQEVEAEVRRLLVASQGATAVAGRIRAALPEDADFLSATVAERAAMRAAVQPLARKLAAQLALKRHQRRGAPDIRRTIRHSLAYGGTPIELVHKRARPAKPELVVLADVSGSVMLFARFALYLLNALQSEFTRVRSYAFVDSIGEISDMLRESDGMVDLVRKVNDHTDVVWLDGRSDYGNTFETFWSRWSTTINARTTVLILGDARNNYHAPNDWVLGEINARARSLMWLNPEPADQWDTGDSLMRQYGAYCDHVFECRNLRQLRLAIGHIIE